MKYGVILLYVVIIIVQIIRLKAQKPKKELVTALFLTFIALIYTYGFLEGWKLPTVDSIIQAIFDPLSQKIFGASHT